MPTINARSLGFSLIELLVCMAIISILTSLILTGYPSVRKKMDGSVSASNLRQISIAMSSYVMENDGVLPPTTNAVGNNDECARLGALYSKKYLTDPRVFVESANARYMRGIGQNMFGVGKDCYYSANSIIYTNWNAIPFVPTPKRLTDDPNVPVAWSMRSDAGVSWTKVRGPKNQVAGYFVYMDGSVRFVYSPQNVIR